MTTERARFDFLVRRDGLAAALRFERENVVQPYRFMVLTLHSWFRRKRGVKEPMMTFHRRVLIERYVQAKRILMEHGA